MPDCLKDGAWRVLELTILDLLLLVLLSLLLVVLLELACLPVSFFAVDVGHEFVKLAAMSGALSFTARTADAELLLESCRWIEQVAIQREAALFV